MKTMLRNGKGILMNLFATLMILLFSACVIAQTNSLYIDTVRIDTATTTTSNPVYVGYELSLGVQLQTLQSSVWQLQNLFVAQQGVRVGAKLANNRGALKGYVGMYYSGVALPVTIDLLEGGIAGTFYLLRTKKRTYHTIEPYVLAAATYKLAKFYGSCLEERKQNRSKEDDALLSNVAWMQPSFGLGAEFQMENDKQRFLHFFLEVRYGTPFLFHASDKQFADTRTANAIGISLGSSFGKFRDKIRKR